MMPDFLDRILGRTPAKKSGSMAKERLQFVLVHDRINLPPERLEAMKQEILAVISKYVSIDSDNVDINLQNRERASLLVAEIPFLKTLEGIDPEEDENDDLPASARPMMNNAVEDSPKADPPVADAPKADSPKATPPKPSTPKRNRNNSKRPPTNPRRP